MGNIRYLESMVDHYWPEMHRNFPAIEKPIIVPARTLRGMAPMYMRRYIDQDENSFYMFIKANPLEGDASREMACRFFDDFFYNKMKMPSSYDAESGMRPTQENPDFGTMTREEAISKEVLPAQDDRNYQQYYDEQMAKMNQEDAEAKKQERINKLGFDPDSEDIIDIDDEGNVIDPEVAKAAKTTAIDNAQSTAVGMPKPIFFAVDFRISAGGNQLGYNSGRLGSARGGSRRLLRNSEECNEEEVEIDDIDTFLENYPAYKKYEKILCAFYSWLSSLDPYPKFDIDGGGLDRSMLSDSEVDEAEITSEECEAARIPKGYWQTMKIQTLVNALNRVMKQFGPNLEVEVYDNNISWFKDRTGEGALLPIENSKKFKNSERAKGFGFFDFDDQLTDSEVEFNESIMKKFRNYFD